MLQQPSRPFTPIPAGQVQNVYDFMRTRFGRPLRVKTNLNTLSTTSEQLVPSNPTRFGLVVNLISSGATIFVAIGPTVSSTTGAAMTGRGATMSLWADLHGEMPAREWSIVALAGTPVVYVLEVLGD